jgi:bacterioferritin-associated ferredoxin
MSVGQPSVETLVCHCYEVTEEQIQRSIQSFDTQTVEEIARLTNAGNGCTACHYRIQRLLAGLPPTCAAADLCDTCGFHTTACECKAA